MAHHINTLYCEINKLKNQQALEAAQFNGWLAAEILNLPTCTKLISMGSIFQALQCQPKNVTFVSATSSCGPQPIYEEKYTISKTGWELVDYKACYWTSNWVNFNGLPYGYSDGDFKPLQYTNIGNLQTLQQDFRYTDDTTYSFSSHNNPAYQMTIVDNANVVADLVAAISEHHQNTDTRSILLSSQVYVTPEILTQIQSNEKLMTLLPTGVIIVLCIVAILLLALIIYLRKPIYTVLVGISTVFLAICNLILAFINVLLKCFPKKKNDTITIPESPESTPSAPPLSSNQQQQQKSTPKTTQPQATTSSYNSSLPTYSSQQQLNENVSCTTIPPAQSAAFYLLPTQIEK